MEKGFRDIVKKSKEECGDKLEEIRQLIFIIRDFNKSIKYWKTVNNKKVTLPKFGNSLVYTCYLESFRTSGHVLFLAFNGLYRNAFDNIRYILESIVQALYIDLRHPKIDLKTKIEILKEIEDKREYHSVRLIDELSIDHKDRLKTEYKRLSRIIHPSHKQVVATIRDITERRGVPATVDCKEVSKIYDSMKKMYDIFFFLFITYFPEVRKSLEKNHDFIERVKHYKLTLSSKVLRIQL